MRLERAGVPGDDSWRASHEPEIRSRRAAQALTILERALAASDQQDVEYTMRARLATVYARRGWNGLAAAHYFVVASGSSRPAQVEVAHAFLLTHPAR